MPEYPLSNVKATAGPEARAVKKKRVSTKFEIDKLQEKYQDPVEKKGKKRAHAGFMNYGQKMDA